MSGKEEFESQPVDVHLRNCYCNLWHDEDRKVFERQDLPYGYCAWCDICGKPGHMRHDPRGPATGGWCDECWDKVTKEISRGGKK